MQNRAPLCAVLFAALIGAFPRPAIADDDIFAIQEFQASGRIVTGSFADFDGDGAFDFMVASLRGVPPEESRTLHVYLRNADGSFNPDPSYDVPLPPWSSVYDIADLRDTPGSELVLLRPDGVTIFSIASDTPRQWDIPVSGSSTVGAGDDERGFDDFKLVYTEFASEPWLLVPQIGMLSALTADGSLMAQMEVGRRANYFIASSSGPFSTESDIQLFLDVPKVAVGDVDGDGRADIVATTRHEIRVFLRAGDGSFPRQASQVLALGFLSDRDHSRGSGSVVSHVRDLDGDGRLDLVVTHVEGSFADANTSTYVYLNRNGRWNLEAPDDTFIDEGILGTDLVFDIDGDQKPDLARVQFKFSVFEIIELLLTQKVDSTINVHRMLADGHYEPKPWIRKKVSTGISFDTFRPAGFLPPSDIDINADGLADFITSANGKGIEVFLGRSGRPYSRRSAIQNFPSSGVIEFADFDGDKLLDFILFDAQEFDGVIRVGHNLGTLPGSPGVPAER